MKNVNRSKLIQFALREGSNEPRLTNDGALSVITAPHTGRSPNAKYIVKDSITQDLVDWDNNQPMSSKEFDRHHEEFSQHFNMSLYKQDLYAGYDPSHRLPIRVHTAKAWHSLFARNMFFHPTSKEVKTFEPEFNVYSVPSHTTEPRVIISFEKRLILISGTDYAGEIKKSVFTVLNFLLPQKDVLSMHCSVSVKNSDTSPSPTVFFGLSGTGKTTLSSDEGSYLVGDDEHGWSNAGLFNFEGGCYAKTVRLSAHKEPLIHKACHKFGTVLENVVIQNGQVDFDNTTITENSRASYPLEFIDNTWGQPWCAHPSNIIMLTCDAYGVLPPVARLDTEKAIEQFLLGYTAKVAGTERGVTTPEPTFSHCFGSPFMPLRPKAYAELLKQKIQEHDVKCWLVNTGWTGGPVGIGKRIDLSITRMIVNSIIDGEFDSNKCEYSYHPYTQFDIPISNKIPEEIRLPERGWTSKPEYEKSARQLMSKFINRLKTMTL
jgi:phosphoenolpyruvate carboxykinase (ATP)